MSFYLRVVMTSWPDLSFAELAEFVGEQSNGFVLSSSRGRR
jgi:hypothetical protein